MKQWRTIYPERMSSSHLLQALFLRGGWRTRLERTLAIALGLALWWLWSNQPLLAATTPGADPTRPFFPTGAWLTLPAHGSHWYAFRDEGDSAAIVVQMTVIPEGGATFAVVTPAALQQWRQGEPLAPVGEGSPLALFPNERYWTGSFVQSGTYYVLVQNRSAGSSSYRLTIAGRDVSFPILSFTQPAMTPTQTVNRYPLGSIAPLSLAPATTAEELLAPVLSSAEKPLPPIGKPMTITVDETHWYAFRDEGDASMIQVRADATPDQCLTFQVWTPEQFTRWQQGEEVKPVGQGTANPTLKADLFWTGSFVKSGIYYVVVRHNPATASPCAYKLLVLGDDVSLIAPVPP